MSPYLPRDVRSRLHVLVQGAHIGVCVRHGSCERVVSQSQIFEQVLQISLGGGEKEKTTKSAVIFNSLFTNQVTTTLHYGLAYNRRASTLESSKREIRYTPLDNFLLFEDFLLLLLLLQLFLENFSLDHWAIPP